jgi:Zeta toxin
MTVRITDDGNDQAEGIALKTDPTTTSHGQLNRMEMMNDVVDVDDDVVVNTSLPPDIPPRRRHSSGFTMTRRRSSVILEMDKPLLALTTEEIHGVDNTTEFFGPYAHLRKLLDYTWYSNYTQQRQWLQDAIIDDLVDYIEGVDDGDVCVTPTEPWLIFTVGPRGAGKAHTIRDLVQARKIPLLSYVPIDPDYIRRRLPEYTTYSAAAAEQHHDHNISNRTKSTSTLIENIDIDVNYMTRKEAGLISELALLAALQNGRNVVFDSAMNNPDWFIEFIEKLKRTCGQEFLGLLSTLKVGLIHITAPPEEMLKRAKLASEITGRIIPDQDILSSIDKISESVQKVIPSMDFHCEIRNNKNSYGCDNIEEVYGLVGDIDWQTLQQTFSQCCAWRPGMKGKTPTRSKKDDDSDSNMKSDLIPNAFHAKLDKRPFDFLISSEENNKSDDMRFYGKYAHLRRTLDYSYHCNYTFERQKLQDAIIDSMLDAVLIEDEHGNVGTVPTKPFIVFTAGAMGAGKSYTINKLVESGRFPLKAFVIVDPDEIRRILPEYYIYIEHNPERAGDLTRKEAGFIAEILTLAALQSGKNCVVDGSLRDHDWYIEYFARLRIEYPKFMQAILHVTAPREAVFARAAKRAEMTGRVVPEETLEKALRQVPESVNILKHHVAYYAEINNPPDAPDVELVEPAGSTWNDFRRQWDQTLAFVTDKKKITEKQQKAKCKLHKVSSSLFDEADDDEESKHGRV